jgi:hypothetical protein
MANKDIQEILKKGSKAKLMQLAIDTREFYVEGLPNRTLTKGEIQSVKDKAKQEGWDGELFRATYKARDIETQTLAAKGMTYEALYYLQMFCKELQRVEIMLDMLRGEYIKDYNEDKDTYETIIDKKQEEVEADISRARGLVFDQLDDITYFKTIQQWGNKQIEEGKIDNKKLTEKDVILAMFRYYKDQITGAKIGFYLVSKAKFAGYRLYKKEQYEELKTAFTVNHLAVVSNIINSLSHIDYLIEVIEENKPELLKELAKNDNIYIPERDKIKEISEYLETHILPPFRKVDRDMIYTKEYLFSDLDKETREKLEEGDKILEEYVRYGK